MGFHFSFGTCGGLGDYPISEFSGLIFIDKKLPLKIGIGIWVYFLFEIGNLDEVMFSDGKSYQDERKSCQPVQ